MTTRDEKKLNRMRQILTCPDDVNLVDKNLYYKEKDRHLEAANKEIGLEVNKKKTKYVFMSHG